VSPERPRVVSLVPSVTETLLDWGIEPVAVTRFCEQPRFEAVGGTKDPDVARIIALAPDLVVVNDEENRKEDAAALEAAGLDLHVVSISSVADVAPELASLRARLELTPLSLVIDPPVAPTGRRAFVPIWRRPWMTMNGDTYGSSVLEHLGVENVFAGSSTRYPEIDIDAVVADVVLAPTEPYPFSERFRAELEVVAPVTFVDGQDLFWWGSRTPDALRRLKAALA
jgi:ABC-type Fe3+-hydroxamate transport system substrate-binding protein